MLRVAFSAFSVRLVSNLLGLFSFVFLITILSPEVFGKYSLYVASSFIFSPLLHLGGHLPLMRILATREKANEKLEMARAFGMGFLLIWVFVSSLAIGTAAFLKVEMQIIIAAIGIYSICISSETITAHLLLGLGKPLQSAVITSGPRNLTLFTFSLACILWPALTPNNVMWFLIIPAALAFATNLLVYFFVTRPMHLCKSWDGLCFLWQEREVISLSRNNFINGVIGQLNANLRVVGSAALFDVSALGSFAAASRMLNFLELAVTSMLMPSLPTIAKRLNQGSVECLNRYLLKLAILMAIVAAAFNLSVIFLAPKAILFTKFADDSFLMPLVMILGIGYLLSTIAGPAFLALQVSSHSSILPFSNALFLILNMSVLIVTYSFDISVVWFAVGLASAQLIHRCLICGFFRQRAGVRSDLLQVFL